ncbi:TPA_asm: SPI-2 type III secretion system translocon protein SseD [Salmonella enterica subsp. salamae serovar 42:z:1,5]|uniref:SPI-2 type III secretion system translocon protein SseD n=2 Tax=Salmonella enterica subsp. salamae TaxID=59202 RepID=A0A737SNQ6_SALER|nr:SPI-2 type III secretion system translocon protein SseD [Salmonella enterica]EAA4435581.1 type III secretion system translocon protein SseD [Salmonella enterica subsp. salamae]ECG1421322.1 SPI-2 type III secretion system translocon protein SseD [Salmonella enterica subsp. salamae str. CFSAN000559]MBA2992207.1 SPI-2 type III secretion system translocon protein SseD [Salmonella enterica subsp. salamae serovar 47:z:e,n,x,z15]HAE7082091.1 SPI-2 type III secretion system translocon protein SseD [
MEASNVASALPMSSLLAPSSTQSPSGERMDTDSLLMLFDEIWMKLMELAKRLRDIMRSYNVVKQRLTWELQVNVLQTQMKTIEQTFKASMITAGGAMLSGVLTIGFGAVGGETGLIAGQAIGHTAGGVMGLGAGVAQRQSDQDKAIADLQQNGAQSYNKSLMDIMDKAVEIMQQIMGMGSSLVEVLAQIFRALTR